MGTVCSAESFDTKKEAQEAIDENNILWEADEVNEEHIRIECI